MQTKILNGYFINYVSEENLTSCNQVTNLEVAKKKKKKKKKNPYQSIFTCYPKYKSLQKIKLLSLYASQSHF